MSICADHDYRCQVCIAERSADALSRMADVLDDYLSMSIAAMASTAALQARDPAIAEMLRPLTDALTTIVERRKARS